MIAYKEISLDRLAISEEASLARKRRLVSQDEYNAIANAHSNDLYNPNIFIRIGLFVLTAIIVLMSFALLYLATGSFFHNDSGFFVLTLILGCVMYGALEWIIQRRRHYRSGVDDALLWLALGQIISSISLYFELAPVWASTLVFILSFAATVRFANSVMSAVAFFSFLAIIFYGIIPFGNVAKGILPFALMAIGIGIYLLVKKIKYKRSLRHYRFCFVMIEVLSLVTIYASVNYFVVRELSIAMFQLPQDVAIAGGWFFWICTFGIPAFYVIRGIQAKDHLMLRAGLLLIAATVFTFRYYHSVAPLEQVMTAGGILMIILAYASIRYLNSPKHGVTDKAVDQGNIESGLQIESLVIAETFKEAQAAEEGFRFGGGSTGGGGASGEF
jgi:uncharacterized membrane protein YgcG